MTRVASTRSSHSSPSFTILSLSLHLLLATIILSVNASDPASGNYDCLSHDPLSSQNELNNPDAPGCLHYLTRKPELYKECNASNSDTTCYIFLQEPPFVTLDQPSKHWSASEAHLSRQTPFRCGKFGDVDGGISGIAMEVHKSTTSSDDLCMWGGHANHCMFNQLVDFIRIKARQGYRFAITGLLLELPSRQCYHTPSAPLVDSSVTIIGSRKEGRVASPLDQLVQPFHWGAWAIFAGVVLVFMLLCFAIAVRFHVFRGRSLVTAFFIFAGERDEALAHEMQVHDGSAAQAMSFATKYGLAMTLYRIALFALLAIFVLFYEVAVVNFLFQQQSVSLSRRVSGLSTKELADYIVLADSALENVWAATVGRTIDPSDDSKVPWKQCPTATNCTLTVHEGNGAKYMVTFDIVGKYLLEQHSDCNTLAVFETKDILYQFNGGWLYNDQVKKSRIKEIDRQIVGLRIAGKTRKFVDEALQGANCDNVYKPNIGPMIILIPCLIFVFPPLICSVLVMLFWKRRKRRKRVHQAAVVAAAAAAAAAGSACMEMESDDDTAFGTVSA